jgi:molybdopterin molybdotransferase
MLTDTPGVRPVVPRDLLDLEEVPRFVRSRLPAIGTTETVPLSRARNRVLAGSVTAPMALPPFDHAAVDGYALGPGHLAAMDVPLAVNGRTRAGDPAADGPPGVLRVLTGAPLHPDVAAVVMQENVTHDGGAIRLGQPVRAGANIRRRGEDVAEGAVVLGEGSVINAGHIALLAALGLDRISVRRRISVAIIAFGNELVAPGREREARQVYDSNSSMAAAFLEGQGCEILSIEHVPDDRARMRSALDRAIGVAELIVTSGGMAVGDEDHTRSLIVDADGVWHSVGIRMRPGKPASLATVGGSTVLSLPGNPFAALVALVVLGLPVVDALSDRRPTTIAVPARSAFSLDRSPGRAEFFPAAVAQGAPTLELDRLGKGGSARLAPLAHADGLGLIRAETGPVSPGDRLGFVSFSAVM